MSQRHETSDPSQTEALAAKLATKLAPGDVVLVSGELGAGKTTFVRGACRALGVQVPVTSPTFTIARRYEDGRVPVSHLDLFRLAEGLGGEEPELLDDELGPDRVAFVEWPEIAGGGRPGVHVAARGRAGAASRSSSARRSRATACRAYMSPRGSGSSTAAATAAGSRSSAPHDRDP